MTGGVRRRRQQFPTEKVESAARRSSHPIKKRIALAQIFYPKPIGLNRVPSINPSVPEGLSVCPATWAVLGLGEKKKERQTGPQ
jgi:hypothetical protein